MTVTKTLLIEYDVPDARTVDAAEEYALAEFERYFRQEMSVLRSMSPSVKKITIWSGQYGVSDIVIT